MADLLVRLLPGQRPAFILKFVPQCHGQVGDPGDLLGQLLLSLKLYFVNLDPVQIAQNPVIDYSISLRWFLLL